MRRTLAVLRVVSVVSSLVLVCAAACAHADDAPRAAAPETLSVSACVERARTHAPDVLAALADERAARFDSAAASHARRPAWSLAGGATVAPQHFYDPTVTDLGGYSAKLAMEWSWLDGGERAREQARAVLGARSGTQSREASARDAALAAGEAALTLARLGEAQQVQREATAWLARLATELRSGVRAGAYGRSDALRVELEQDAASAEGSGLEREAGDARRELAKLLALGAGAAVEVRAPSRDEAAAPVAADSARIADAFARDAGVALAALETQRAQLELRDAETRNAWHVDVSADAGLAGADLTRLVPPDLLADDPHATFGDRLRRDLGASAALTFTRPVFDAAQPASVVARRASLEAAQVRERAARADAQRDADALLARWRTAAAQHAAAIASLSRADEHLLRMRSLYAAGATTLLELLDARQTREEALGREADARYEVRAARLALEVR